MCVKNIIVFFLLKYFLKNFNPSIVDIQGYSTFKRTPQ